MESPLILGKDVPFKKVNGCFLKAIKLIDKPDTLPPGPYCYVLVESFELQKILLLPIVHKNDFYNLYEALDTKEDNQEVIIIWTNTAYKNIIFKLLSPFMPKIIVWLCEEENFNILTNSNYKPELTALERFKYSHPIKEWKPEVMN